jgi:hypothetical protein
MFAMTFEQAQKYVPRQIKKTSSTTKSVTVSKTTCFCSCEREHCSRGWQSVSRSDFGFNRPNRSWKRHRQTQRGNLRI